MRRFGSPLGDLQALPLLPHDSVTSFGPTLVVAPHPDDESLGCGGAITLLRERDILVHVLFVSDGTGSHPNSRKYDAHALRALREAEALTALARMGVPAECATFLRLPDREVPGRTMPGFSQAVDNCLALVRAAATILTPWRRDPHRDHRAAWEIISAAVEATRAAPRIIEYPIWMWDLATESDIPLEGEMSLWRLDIAAVLPVKLAAIAAHRSQTTGLIDDDPSGFRLEPETLAHFNRPWEIYLEPHR